jgi:hypothetical protein
MSGDPPSSAALFQGITRTRKGESTKPAGRGGVLPAFGPPPSPYSFGFRVFLTFVLSR